MWGDIMNFKAINMFLSEENIKRHYEHLRTLRLKYSVLEKSVPEVKGREIKDIATMSINRKIREEALSLLWNIKSHELFFNSFIENPMWPEDIRKHNSTRESLAYEIFMESKDKNCGFIYVYTDKHKKLLISFSNLYDGTFLKYEPMLCIDLFEHAYFNDYGFKKEDYIRAALNYLDTGKLS